MTDLPALRDAVFRPMKVSDLTALAELDELCSPSPWSRPQFQAELGKTFSRFQVLDLPSFPAAGFGGFWMVRGEAQLVNLVVHPRFQGQGWGRRILRGLLKTALSLGGQRAALEVREHNAPARALYQSEGFVETSRRPYFYEGKETAVLMEKYI